MELSKPALEMLDNAKAIGWDLKLSTIKAVLKELDNPQDKVPSIHVTGTNGKGSVCEFINSIAIAAGIKVGKYSSPAIDCEYERYTINGNWINKEEYNSLLEELVIPCKTVLASGLRHPSLFELETCLAFLYFQKSACQLMIVEVGMGGLLDATNVIAKPLACIFSNIDLEHTSYLGTTLTEIAQNKGGIIKDNSTVITCKQHAAVEQVLRALSDAHNCRYVEVLPLSKDYELGLKGEKQYLNAAIAKEAALLLNQYGFSIDSSAITKGLKNAFIPYRFEKLDTTPTLIFDGSHNVAAISVLKQNLIDYFPNVKKTFIISALKDKDFFNMCKEILPLAEDIILVEASNERAMPKADLFKCARHFSNACQLAYDYETAVNMAFAFDNELIVVFGTFSYLCEMKSIFLEKMNFD